MNWPYAIRPTKRKVIASVVPFIFLSVQLLVKFELSFDVLPLTIDLIIETPVTLIALTEAFIARPFEPILRSMGWWSRDSIFVGPDGPLLPGSFAVAITYSIIIYLTLSLLLARKRK